MYSFHLYCFGFLSGGLLFAHAHGEEPRARNVGPPGPRVVTSGFLAQLRAEVRTTHPTVAAAEARARAAGAAVGEVRLWEDPSLGFSLMAAETSMRQDDGDILVAAEQMLPRRGLYEARRGKALATRAIREAETQTVAVDLETVVAQTALELALTDEALEIEAQQLKWIESMAASARQRLADPTASAVAPLKLEAELATARQKLAAARRARVSLGLRLNTLLGRETDRPWPTLALTAAPLTGPALNSVLAKLSATNPQLRALSQMAAAAEAEVLVSEKERAPAFSIGSESAFYSGGDFRQTTFGFKISLPWVNGTAYRAATERARLEQTAAANDREGVERRLRGEVIAAFNEAESAAHQAASQAAEVIPKAQKAAEAIENAWISSQATLLEVLEARSSWLAARLEQRRLVAAQYAALETLRSLVPPPPAKP